MSFGFSISDVVLLGELAWNVVQNFRKACGEHAEGTREASALHVVLGLLQQEVDKPESLVNRSGETCRDGLQTIVADCGKALSLLDKVLGKYNALSEEERSGRKLWLKIRFGSGEVADVRDLRNKILFYTSGISFYVNMASMGSIGRVEKRMDETGGHLKDIKFAVNAISANLLSKGDREGSVLTAYTDDDRMVWREFRRELVKDGFSSPFLKKNRRLIVAYIEELGSRGLFDDRDPQRTQQNSSAAMIDPETTIDEPTRPADISVASPLDAVVEGGTGHLRWAPEAKTEAVNDHVSENGNARSHASSLESSLLVDRLTAKFVPLPHDDQIEATDKTPQPYVETDTDSASESEMSNCAGTSPLMSGEASIAKERPHLNKLEHVPSAMTEIGKPDEKPASEDGTRAMHSCRNDQDLLNASRPQTSTFSSESDDRSESSKGGSRPLSADRSSKGGGGIKSRAESVHAQEAQEPNSDCDMNARDLRMPKKKLMHDGQTKTKLEENVDKHSSWPDGARQRYIDAATTGANFLIGSRGRIKFAENQNSSAKFNWILLTYREQLQPQCEEFLINLVESGLHLGEEAIIKDVEKWNEILRFDFLEGLEALDTVGNHPLTVSKALLFEEVKSLLSKLKSDVQKGLPLWGFHDLWHSYHGEFAPKCVKWVVRDYAAHKLHYPFWKAGPPSMVHCRKKLKAIKAYQHPGLETQKRELLNDIDLMSECLQFANCNALQTLHDRRWQLSGPKVVSEMNRSRHEITFYNRGRCQYCPQTDSIDHQSSQDDISEPESTRNQNRESPSKAGSGKLSTKSIAHGGADPRNKYEHEYVQDDAEALLDWACRVGNRLFEGPKSGVTNGNTSDGVHLSQSSAPGGGGFHFPTAATTASDAQKFFETFREHGSPSEHDDLFSKFTHHNSLTSFETKFDEIISTFKTDWQPRCVRFLKRKPQDPAARGADFLQLYNGLLKLVDQIQDDPDMSELESTDKLKRKKDKWLRYLDGLVEDVRYSFNRYMGHRMVDQE